MFQSNVEGVQHTKLRVCTEAVHIGCSLSVQACYKLSATIYFDVSRRLQCRSFSVLMSWTAVKQVFTIDLNYSLHHWERKII